MGAKRRKFSAEFKLEAVRMVQESGSLSQVSRELGVRSDTLGRWCEEAGGRAGLGGEEIFPGQGKVSSKDEEIRRLRRENELLKQERAFLKKAAAYFAKDTR